MPAIPIGAITIYYDSHGKGDPLILLPDLGNDVSSLEALIANLTPHFRCIAIDNRGVGRSAKPSTPYTTKLMADDTIHVLEYLRIDKAHFFGAAMGAAIAQEVALNYPDRVGRSVYLGAWAKPDRFLISLFEMFRDVKRSVDPLTFDREVALWSFTRSYFDLHYDELERRQRAALDVPYPTPPTTFTRQAEACIAHNTLERLDQYRGKVLLTIGAEDIFTPRRFVDQIAARLTKPKIEEIPGAAHAAYWEQPAALAEAIRGFLAA